MPSKGWPYTQFQTNDPQYIETCLPDVVRNYYRLYQVFDIQGGCSSAQV